MKISNSQEASHYYGIINKAIDKYLKEWNVSLSNLIKYLKIGSKGYNNLLSNNDLEDVEGIEHVVKDVLDDRKRGMKDIKNYNIIMYNEFNESTESFIYEKVLADHFSTSIGFITMLSKNKYSVKSFGDVFEALIYSYNDLKEIYEGYITSIVDEYQESKTKLNKTFPLEIDNFEVMDIKKFRRYIKSKLPKGTLFDKISSTNGMKFNKSIEDKYYIWKKED